LSAAVISLRVDPGPKRFILSEFWLLIEEFLSREVYRWTNYLMTFELDLGYKPFRFFALLVFLRGRERDKVAVRRYAWFLPLREAERMKIPYGLEPYERSLLLSRLILRESLASRSALILDLTSALNSTFLSYTFFFHLVRSPSSASCSSQLSM